MVISKLKEEIQYWKDWISHEQEHIDKCQDKETLVLLNNRKRSAERILSELLKQDKENS